jgi:CheY-like chemotaxis protein
MSSLLHDTPLNQFQQEAVRMITTSGDLLSTIVDDVLDYSKLVSGDFTLDVRPRVDLQSTLDSVTTAVQMKADTSGRGLWVRSYIGTNVPQWYETDSKRLQQILYNLLGNAVKFSRDNGYIDLKCNIVNDPVRKTKRIHFKVKDYGAGIAAENYSKIFEPFHQENKNTSTIYGGTGLGLPITKKLVEKLGGTISVESEVGKWTEFTVDFPYHGPEVTDFASEVTRLSDTSILVVVARPTTDCPVIKWLRDQSIHVELIPSCKDLEPTAETIEANAAATNGKRQYYIPLIHDEAFDQVLYRSFADKYPSQLMSFGYKNVDEAAAHVHSPCRVFPSLFLPILGDLVERLKTGPLTKRIDTTLDTSILIINNQKPKEQVVETSESSSDTGISYDKIKVLIAEDNKINQRVLVKTLNRLGMKTKNIDVVENGLEAVNAASKKSYDCIFMDMEMPVMNGLEACRLISKNKVRLLPIIVFVTAHAMETFRNEARQAGGFGFISKPFNLEKIDSLIKSVPWDSLTETERRTQAVAQQTSDGSEKCATSLCS